MVQNDGEKTEYRLWNPFRSKLAAAVLAGLDNIYIRPGAKVLYLGAASGTSVSHVSDIVGPQGAQQHACGACAQRCGHLDACCACTTFQRSPMPRSLCRMCSSTDTP